MSVADILFYSSNDIGGTLIKWRTGGPYVHCCIEVEGAKVIEAKYPLVSYDERGVPAAVCSPKVDSTRVPDALAWLHSTVGDRYDIWDIVSCGVGILFPHKKVFTVPTMFICSELAVWFLIKAGYTFPDTFQKDEERIDLVSPNDLARLMRLL